MEVRLRELGSVLTDCGDYRGHEFWQGYQWGETEWKQLWNTIMEAYRTDSKNRFLGQIIIKSKPHQKWDLPDMILVDGLQRILSASVILAVIWRSRTAWYSPIHCNYLRYQRVLLSCEETFQSATSIFEGYGPEVAGGHPLQKAYRFFKAVIAAAQDGEGYDLDRLADVILYGLKVSVVTIDDDEDIERVCKLVNCQTKGWGR